MNKKYSQEIFMRIHKSKYFLSPLKLKSTEDRKRVFIQYYSLKAMIRSSHSMGFI